MVTTITSSRSLQPNKLPQESYNLSTRLRALRLNRDLQDKLGFNTQGILKRIGDIINDFSKQGKNGETKEGYRGIVNDVIGCLEALSGSNGSITLDGNTLTTADLIFTLGGLLPVLEVDFSDRVVDAYKKKGFQNVIEIFNSTYTAADTYTPRPAQSTPSTKEAIPGQHALAKVPNKMNVTVNGSIGRVSFVMNGESISFQVALVENQNISSEEFKKAFEKRFYSAEAGVGFLTRDLRMSGIPILLSHDTSGVIKLGNFADSIINLQTENSQKPIQIQVSHVDAFGQRITSQHNYFGNQV